MSVEGTEICRLFHKGICRLPLVDPPDAIVAIRVLELIILNDVPLEVSIKGFIITRYFFTHFIKAKSFSIPTGDLKESCCAFKSA